MPNIIKHMTLENGTVITKLSYVYTVILLILEFIYNMFKLFYSFF